METKQTSTQQCFPSEKLDSRTTTGYCSTHSDTHSQNLNIMSPLDPEIEYSLTKFIKRVCNQIDLRETKKSKSIGIRQQ